MFDVGFQELALIFGVSLLVLGPKRLPGLVSKVGRWVGKARVMARDFQQQLENEISLEELNRMTEMQTRQSQNSTPPSPPPEAAAEPQPESPPTYPYSAPPDTSATDDTFSHAHAAGDAPMADAQEHVDVQEHAPGTVAGTDEPVQADLDLSTPEDNSHLPPDDARRYT